ncbi:hypothetical protein Tco_0947947 [Tanacetum coccineum]
MASYPTILEADTISSKAWVRLKDIFQDNKNSRTVYLEHQFTNTRLKHFYVVSAYCQELKILLGQLFKVEALYSNNRPVLQLIFGLNESHDNVVRFIQQSDLIPTFYEARFKLILEETYKNKQAENAAIRSRRTLNFSFMSYSDSKNQNNPSTCTFPQQQHMQHNDPSYYGRRRTNNNRRCGQNRGGHGGRGHGRLHNNQPHQFLLMGKIFSFDMVFIPLGNSTTSFSQCSMDSSY